MSKGLWAVRTVRERYKKEILSAVIVSADTMIAQDLSEDDIRRILASGMAINNLGLAEDGTVVLAGYDRTAREHNTQINLSRMKYGSHLYENYIVVIGGYSCVYDFIGYANREVIRFTGTVRDMEEYLKTKDVTWEKHAVFNGYVTDRTYAFKNDGRNRIAIYMETPYPVSAKIDEHHIDLLTPDMKRISQIRNNINCEWCILDQSGENIVIRTIEFTEGTDIELPDGITHFSRSYGRAYSVFMPSTLQEINKKAFKDDTDILQLTINSKLRSIPKECCADTNLQIFEYPTCNTLESIDDGAFKNCMDLKSSLISQVRFIGRCAFSNTSIPKVSIPYCVEVKAGAFLNCQKLKQVKLGNSVAIYEGAFKGCSKLESINLMGATFIAKDAFKGCKKLKTVEVSKNATISKDAFDKNVEIIRL